MEEGAGACEMEEGMGGWGRGGEGRGRVMGTLVERRMTRQEG